MFSECPDKTYGYGCLDCSNKCSESKCVKFSSTMNCSNGCIAGYMGTDCSSGISIYYVFLLQRSMCPSNSCLKYISIYFANLGQMCMHLKCNSIQAT